MVITGALVEEALEEDVRSTQALDAQEKPSAQQLPPTSSAHLKSVVAGQRDAQQLLVPLTVQA